MQLAWVAFALATLAGVIDGKNQQEHLHGKNEDSTRRIEEDSDYENDKEDDEDDPTYYMRFPHMTDIPKTKAEAIQRGFAPWSDFVSSESSCDNGGVGDIYIHDVDTLDYRQHGLYPALFYRNYDDKLAGLIFAIDKDLVLERPDFLAGNHPWRNDEMNLVGQIYWFQNPNAVCLDTAPKRAPKYGVYMNVTTCIDAIGDGDCTTGIQKIPKKIGSAASLSSRLNMQFTDQLCFEGMGDHYTYGHCSRAYTYVVLADARGKFAGVVNSIHLDETKLTNYAAATSGDDTKTWQHFVGPDADPPLFLQKMNDLEAQYPLVEWGLPDSIEAKPFYALRGLIFDDEILPIGRVCGEEGKVGFVPGADPLVPGCFLCKPTPRLLMHVYKDRLPNRDFRTCERGHKVTKEGRDKNVIRCGMCQVYTRNVALKSVGDQCSEARRMFRRSCGRSDHYGQSDDEEPFVCKPLDYLGGKVLGFNGGGLMNYYANGTQSPCLWE